MEEIKEVDYTISEDYNLPSQGLIYEGKRVNPRVKLRSMTTREEMKRQSPTNTPYKTLAEIIEGCMIEKPEVHVYDMCIGDYEYLLHKLRTVSYTNIYKMSVGCPTCHNYVDLEVNLDDLKVNDYKIDEFRKLLTVELPKSKHIVGLRFQTPRILDEIEIRAKELNKQFKNNNVDYRLYTTLLLAIDTIDGNKVTPIELEGFINKLPVYDSNLIINNLKKSNRLIGLDTSINESCPKCGQDIETFFRFGPEFFRPEID